ncbi:hypothetical protein CEP52_005120 [Fusarium oligoseptatum]|uniref:Uncharacterized protein n=1 Tax=Fusarium oligoseptatum TaxID=2604345 RepID=A0A428TZX8_9HYPO|nr:hypothetical protein CEP52_005120 [Fusarium oligoseptatum]
MADELIQSPESPPDYAPGSVSGAGAAGSTSSGRMGVGRARFLYLDLASQLEATQYYCRLNVHSLEATVTRTAPAPVSGKVLLEPNPTGGRYKVRACCILLSSISKSERGPCVS